MISHRDETHTNISIKLLSIVNSMTTLLLPRNYVSLNWFIFFKFFLSFEIRCAGTQIMEMGWTEKKRKQHAKVANKSVWRLSEPWKVKNRSHYFIFAFFSLQETIGNRIIFMLFPIRWTCILFFSFCFGPFFPLHVLRNIFQSYKSPCSWWRCFHRRCWYCCWWCWCECVLVCDGQRIIRIISCRI